MPLPNLSNTEIAFQNRSNRELKRAKFLFSSIGHPGLVKTGSRLIRFAIRNKLPVSWALKPTIFAHFCGGISLKNCTETSSKLFSSRVNSILDYSAEGADNQHSRDECFAETIASAQHAAQNKNIPFVVFKPSGLIQPHILEKAATASPLSESEKQALGVFRQRCRAISQHCVTAGVKLLIDAEDYSFQDAVDVLAMQLMEEFNINKAVVFNTLQLYRKDRLTFLKNSHSAAIEKRYIPGFKLVRGAYMENERALAKEKNYPSPIHESKADTDEHFNRALEYCVTNIETLELFCGTHNEESNLLLCQLMQTKGLNSNDPRIWFAQLYGMSDHITFNLASEGYNVAKYIPYGPVKKVVPYLIRRAEENTSVKGQSGRELTLIKTEISRRKKQNQL